ncbi:uncharacterized protein MEPE_00700 [Melanopsichium pennsylvanicum]|uniref:Uncharacterized protein n=2 Tax=Melanopsichium pennsylvanicum TaxID=63383 RepID=A0AAJ4XGF0_9BASI|nr:putative protein [Melanopsichium pennsylvanicum 4]SNX81995.1 uncharacterized protein MEPE_00700 [Melanopsichium pennsylvanicum]
MFQDATNSPPGRTGPQLSYAFATPVRAPSTSYHNLTGAAYSQALTPPTDSKAVRFQSQPLPPQTHQSHHQLNSALTSNRFAASSSSSALQTQSRSPARAPATSNDNNTTTSSTAAVSKSMAGTRPAPSLPSSSSLSSLSSNTVFVNGASTIALSRRIKWNLSALALLWILPALTSKPRDVYWTILDQIHLYVGGETDELADGIVGWALWAISVILLFNAVEALIHLSRASSLPKPQQQQGLREQKGAANGKGDNGLVLGMHSPQVMKSLNFVAASRSKGSPKTRTNNIGPGSPISQQQQMKRDSPSTTTMMTGPISASPNKNANGGGGGVDYSQFSPSLRRGGSPQTNNVGFNGATPSRMTTTTLTGSPTKLDYGVIRTNSSSSSPLAAFRARHACTRAGSSPSSVGATTMTPSIGISTGNVDLYLDGITTRNDVDGDDQQGVDSLFLGDESFEVDRALKSLRDSYHD